MIFAFIHQPQGTWPVTVLCGALGVSPHVVAMFLSFAVASAALGIMIPLADAYALQGLSARGRSYGPVRLWGSVAFIAGNLAAGMLAAIMAPRELIWPIAAAFSRKPSRRCARLPRPRAWSCAWTHRPRRSPSTPTAGR